MGSPVLPKEKVGKLEPKELSLLEEALAKVVKFCISFAYRELIGDIPPKACFFDIDIL